MSGDDDRRAELARFLKTRREAIQPGEVGLPVGERRRTTGLRREEVAILAGVSPTWYTYLEQGRKIRPSSEVLNSLATVLMLTQDARRYLFLLALGQAPPHEADIGDAEIADIERVVASAGHGPDPVYATSWLCDMLAWNEPAARWYTDWGALPPERRNMLWWLLNDPEARERLVDWETETRDVIARFRALSVSRRERGRLDEVLELLRESPEFVKWWDDHDVHGQQSRVREMVHPEYGLRSFQLTVLYPGNQDEYMVVLHPPAGPAPDGGGRRAGVARA